MRIKLSRRMVIVAGCVFMLPVAAWPISAGWIDVGLYRVPVVEVGSPLLQSGSTEVIVKSGFSDRASPADIENLAWSTGKFAASAGLDTVSLPPPAPVTAFEPLAAPGAPQEEALGEEALSRLQQIRQRLEDLGAEYVVVETTDGTGRYRFHCRMTIDQSQFTRPFEAVSADPLQAGEQVLREVQAWRSAASANLPQER